MKKPYKLIFIGILAIILVAVFKDGHEEDLTAPANISEELSQLPVNEKVSKRPVDFSTCLPKDSFSVKQGVGSNSLKILGPEDDFCLAQVEYQIDSGYYVNDCKIPLATGIIVFEDGNFEPITPFCTIKTTGSGLLELE